MGFYIETSGTHDKAFEIAEEYGGEVHLDPPNYELQTEQGNGIIVVIDNGLFEAAGFAHSKDEYDIMTRADDPRPRQYVIIPREDAELASGYRR